MIREFLIQGGKAGKNGVSSLRKEASCDPKRHCQGWTPMALQPCFPLTRNTAARVRSSGNSFALNPTFNQIWWRCGDSNPGPEIPLGSASTSLARVFPLGPGAPTGRIALAPASLSSHRPPRRQGRTASPLRPRPTGPAGKALWDGLRYQFSA